MPSHQPTTISLRIAGMACDHCVASVRAALSSVPGVSARAVALGSAELEVSDPQALRRALAALDEAGFDASVASHAGGPGPACGGDIRRTHPEG